MEINLKERREHREGVRQNHGRTESWGQDYSSQDFMILSRHDSAAPVPPYPKGIPQQSPGLRAASYPWKTHPTHHNPERVAASHERQHAATNGHGHNPFRVDDNLRTLPRVAPLSQPWAELHNPVGIETGVPASLIRNFFQRLGIDPVKRIGCCISHLRVGVFEQFQQCRYGGSSLICKASKGVCATNAHARSGIFKDVAQSWHDYSRVQSQPPQCQSSKMGCKFVFVIEALDQQRHSRTSICPEKRHVDKDLFVDWHLMVREHCHQRVQALRSEMCQGIGCPDCTESGFGIRHQPGQFRDCRFGFWTQFCDRFRCSKQTQRILILLHPVGLKTVRQPSGCSVQLKLPGGRFVADPFQQTWQSVGSYVADGFRSVATILSVVRPKLIHPRSQRPTVKAWLTRRKGNNYRENNQHRNRDQNQNEASSLLHGPTIMRPHGAETSRKAQQQGNNFSQKQTKITKTGKGISETSSFPSFPSVKEYFFALHLFVSCSAIRAIGVIRGSISLRALRYLLFKSDSRPFAVHTTLSSISHLLTTN